MLKYYIYPFFTYLVFCKTSYCLIPISISMINHIVCANL